MDPIALQSTLLDIYNKSRQGKGLVEAFDAEDLTSDLSSIAQSSAVHILPIPEEAPDDVNNWVENQVIELLGKAEEGNVAAEITELLPVLYASNLTHLGVIVTADDTEVRVLVQAYFFYLRLDPLGPMIDGDIVLQGSIVGSNKTKMGPALCVVEKDGGDGNWSELLTVTPERMIISPPDDENSEDETRFMIPIQVPEEERSSVLRMQVYVQDFATISYEAGEGAEGAVDRTRMVLASTCSAMSPVEWPGNMEGMEDMGDIGEMDGVSPMKTDADDEDMRPESSPAMLDKKPSASNFAALESNETDNYIVESIVIATDYDDIMALQGDGYVLQALQLTPEGPVQDQEFLWKFHVMFKYGPKNEPGIEDVQFVKCLKSLGTLPTLPFFKVMHDLDLSAPEGDYSVYLAYRMGPHPRFSQIVMVGSTPENEIHLKSYISQQNAVFVEAVPEIDRAFSGVCGLLLVKSAGGELASTARSGSTSIGKAAEDGEDASIGKDLKEGFADGESDEESSDEDYNDEEDVVAALQQQLREFETEKQSLQTLNAELQKKVVQLMAREKALQGQGAGRGPAGEVSAVADGADAGNEQSIEKEKQYQDVLQLIVVERGKLNKQLKEFDQLALDLQTRLDDKEFKAKSIATSFKQFKKEILEKATNSRTGHHLPEKHIQQIEATELKYEEDLEKVRLRNISLRTSHKKLERTLRAREQLAEGLHMIDFEQLKIENQTLNEKIEERNEDLAKLKRKKTTTVQVLTHTREKLRFVEQANRVQQDKLSGLEQVITDLRNQVTLLKLERDQYRGENGEMKTKQSFATSDLLLNDYEQQKSKVDQLGATVQELKHRYELLNRQVQTAQLNTKNSASAPWLLKTK